MIESLFRPVEFPRYETFEDGFRVIVESANMYDELCASHGMPIEYAIANRLNDIDKTIGNVDAELQFQNALNKYNGKKRNAKNRA